MTQTLSVNFDKKSVEQFLEYDIITKDILVNNKTKSEINTVATNGTCSNFLVKRFIPMLAEISQQHKFIKRNFIKNNNEDAMIIHYTILHNKYSEYLFETFKKLGISIASLEIGVNWKDKIIYLNSNRFSDFKKCYGTERFTALMMYVVSMAYSINELFNEPITTTYNTYTNVLGIETDRDLSSYLYNFDKDNDEYELRIIDYHEITFLSTSVNSIANNDYNARLFKMGEYTVLKRKTGEDYSYSILYACNFIKGVSPAFLITPNCIFTSQVMDLPSLGDNSIESILMLRNATNTVVYKENILDEFEWESASRDECLETDGDIYQVLYRAIFELFDISNIEETFTIKKYNEFLNASIKINKVVLDTDSIKELYKDDEYAQNLYSQIQDYYEDFDLKDLAPVVSGVAKGDIYSMLLYGASGSGKSTAARVIMSRTGIPYISINCSTNIEESDLFGSMIPNPNADESKDRPFIWQDGLITKALRGYGYGVIVEEGNFARPGILGKLNSLLDEARQIELPNGEVLKAPKNFRLIFTCNIAYEGTQKFNKAFINRFQIVKEYTTPTRDELIEIIKSRTKYKDTTKINAILNVFESIQKYSNDNNLDLVVSVRQLLTVFTIGKYFKTAQDAVMNNLINVAFVEDPEYKEDYVSTVLGSFKLTFKL